MNNILLDPNTFLTIKLMISISGTVLYFLIKFEICLIKMFIKFLKLRKNFSEDINEKNNERIEIISMSL